MIVAGAGIVGAAIAYGLAGYDKRVLMLDGADTDYRAAKANFGLVWVQGKGYRYPEYHRLSAAAADAWPFVSARPISGWRLRGRRPDRRGWRWARLHPG